MTEKHHSHHAHHTHHVHHHPDKKKEQAPETITFSVKEFHHSAKNDLWYIGIGLLLVALLFVGWQNKNYLFMAVVVAMGIALFKVINLKPETKEIRITKKGLYWGDHFYAYHQIRCFWLAKTGEHISIYFERLNYLPTIHILIPENKVEDAIDILVDHLPLHDHKNEPLHEKFARMLGI